MTQRDSTSTRAVFGPRWDPAVISAVALFGLVLSLFSTWGLHLQLQTQRSLEFEWVAGNRSHVLKNGIERDLQAVETAAEHQAALLSSTEREFEAFASALLERSPGLQVLSFYSAEHVGENEARALWQVGSPDGEPLGADAPATEHVATLLSRARTDKELVLSEAYSVPGGVRVLAAAPVPSTDDRSSIGGFVVGQLDVEQTARAVIALLEPRGVDLEVRDVTDGTERRLATYTSRLESDAQLDSPALQATPQATTTIKVAGRTWTIVAAATPNFRSAEAFEQAPAVVLVVGLLLTVLLTAGLSWGRRSVMQRLRAERVLSEREDLFRQMTETVDEIFWAAEADWSRMLYVGPRYARMLGIAGDRLYEEPGRLKTAIHPDDRAAYDSARAAFEGAPRQQEVVFRVVQPDGSVRWLRDTWFPIQRASGDVARIVGVCVDVTAARQAAEALRASERTLRNAFNESPDLIMTVSRDRRVLMSNRPFPDLEPSPGEPEQPDAFLPSKQRKRFRKLLKKSFRNQKVGHLQYPGRDSTWWEARVVPIVSGDEVTEVMVIATDITRTRSLQAQAIRSAQLASLGVLAAGAAHEINNPNNAIHFNASLFRRVWTDVQAILQEYREDNGEFSIGGLTQDEARAQVPGLIDGMLDNSRRIGRIIDNLKHLGRVDRGEMDQSVELHEVLQAAATILHGQIERHTLHFEMELPDELPTVVGNTQQLEQVFINIIQNALYSLPERSRGVRVSARSDEEAGRVLIVVQDDGRGIPSDDLERLTEPFFSTRTEAGGLGLGLAITRSILDNHNGGLSFSSRVGQGTQVTIDLPAAPPAKVE